MRFAESFGIPGTRVSSCGALTEALSTALTAEGPSLVEVWLPDVEEG
ncbi:thiamine pyrophosphate-dependent enzyme [Candidatus Latescibacterota bacterium]